ncbi:CMGC SRPK kinase [Fusarium phyllophilum]|uniref:CMGC SRPK kinase n=1 Tax=Fusarium phyllophilum TaxID=47803 RepID=A0A8H5NCW9_9HYPO|nr:CMGC SRPK kinase [Fusarium phyllophilum]
MGENSRSEYSRSIFQRAAKTSRRSKRMLHRMIRAWPLMALYQRPWPISSAVAPRLDPSILVEEDKIPKYHADRFYPIHLGQFLNGRYQIAAKLGYGANSTVRLAQDLNRLAASSRSSQNDMIYLTCRRWHWSSEKYVAIKVNATNQRSRRPKEHELDIMRHISQVNPKHRGWHFIRKFSDSSELQGALGSQSLTRAVDMATNRAWVLELAWTYTRVSGL